MSSLDILRNRNFRFFILARLMLVTAGQMLFVAIGWQVYAITKSTLHLGLVGLAGFLPSLLFALPGGHVADRVERRKIMMACAGASAFASAGLALLAQDALLALYGMSALLGTLRSFNAPASQALLPRLVPRDIFPRAIAWGLIVFQVAVIAGPSLGGHLIDWTRSVRYVYASSAGLYALAFVALGALRPLPAPREPSPGFGAAVVDGLRYVWHQKVLFGAMSLDLFAVLLGGATALLPVFATDILKMGASELGYLRSAFAVGAGAMALTLAVRPLTRHLGPVMFAGVAVFGLATVVFGISRSFWLTLAALGVAGAADMLSVAVRHTLIQMSTPDSMRGRVSAVSFVFIGASNELGEFESGITASWWGPVRAVVVGGLGTCAIVLVWMGLFPDLRRADRLPGTGDLEAGIPAPQGDGERAGDAPPAASPPGGEGGAIPGPRSPVPGP